MQEDAFTAPLTCSAHVQLLSDGSLRPRPDVPRDVTFPAAASSPEGVAGAPNGADAGGSLAVQGAPVMPALPEPGWALARELMEDMGARARPHALMNQYPLSLHGLLAGGIMCGLFTHPVLGRAVFTASVHGLQGLCQL